MLQKTRLHPIRKLSPIIDVIAPAGKVKDLAELTLIKDLLTRWGYRVRFGRNILSDHAFLSNTLLGRFEDLKKALYNPSSDIIWCYRGGTGSAELLSLLETLTPPKQQKIFLGFSDITALHIFFNQQWQWKTFHGPVARQIALHKVCVESENAVQDLFQHQYKFNLNKFISIDYLKPLNISAQHLKKNDLNISGVISGGNLSIISHSLGTPYQIQTDNKILLLEDIHEPAYKIRRMLTQLLQAQIFRQIKMLILGEFISDQDISQEHLIQQELHEFAEQQGFPVFQTKRIGHGQQNIVLPLGHKINIKFKD